jgi:transposase-like protein
MMSKSANKFSPEVRARAVRMVQEHGGGGHLAGLLVQFDIGAQARHRRHREKAGNHR